MNKNIFWLFKLDKNNKVLNKLNSLELNSERKDIQEIFENNLSIFFPKLTFLKSEYRFLQNKADSIAYCRSQKTFFIIEYKTLKGNKGGKVIPQVLTYLNDLKDEPEEQFNLVNFWNQQKGQELWLNYNDVEWDKAKVICISPEFQRFEWNDKETILIEIKRYEGNIFCLEGKKEQLELLGIKNKVIKKADLERNKEVSKNEEKEKTPSLLITEGEKETEKFLQEKGIKEIKIKEWVLEIDNFLKNKYSLNSKLFAGAKEKRVWYIKYNKSKYSILSLVPLAKKINIFFNKLTESNDFSLKLIKKHGLKDYRSKGHHGDLGNDWKYEINDENNFSQIFELLDAYFKKVVEK